MDAEREGGPAAIVAPVEGRFSYCDHDWGEQCFVTVGAMRLTRRGALELLAQMEESREQARAFPSAGASGLFEGAHATWPMALYDDCHLPHDFRVPETAERRPWPEQRRPAPLAIYEIEVGEDAATFRARWDEAIASGETVAVCVPRAVVLAHLLADAEPVEQARALERLAGGRAEAAERLVRDACRAEDVALTADRRALAPLLEHGSEVLREAVLCVLGQPEPSAGVGVDFDVPGRGP